MWNINIRSGSIWTVKSINELSEGDKIFEGMTYGTSYVLLLSAFTDIDNVKKFTYFKVHRTPIKYKTMLPIVINSNKTMYVELDQIQTGNQKSLESFIYRITLNQIQGIAKAAKSYFNLNIDRKRLKTSINTEKVIKESLNRKIFKFGIEVYVKESENVHIDNHNRIMLSNKARQDIIVNGIDDVHIEDLCYKYQIFPVKAIKEIRRRLVYQQKHNKD